MPSSHLIVEAIWPSSPVLRANPLTKNPESTGTIKMVYSGKHAIMGLILFSNMMTVTSP